ncbi:tyrosine-type recombinase/integrase [Muribaculum intestinale]|uniref:tyrosine-type recombinase/integrase n=1 Tax=Muribaculum intestinale TaxID=1796646 RepID=UPI0025B78221|nr:tyrosine-type recombinase/integrase [Muribaculum intestinale]
MPRVEYSYRYVVTGDRLRARITWNGVTVTISTGFRVVREKFDKSRCTRNSTHFGISATEINKALESLESKVAHLFARCIPTREQVLAVNDLHADGRPNAPTLDQLWQAYLADGKTRQWAPATSRARTTVWRLCRKWNPDIRADEITHDTLDKFVAWLFSNSLTSVTYRNSCVERHAKHLLSLLLWASRKKLITADNFQGWSPVIKKTDRQVTYLTAEELNRIEALTLAEDSTLGIARAYLLLCSYTSLRFSDAYALRWGNVDFKADMIRVVTQKTSSTLGIDLNTHSRAILKACQGSGTPKGSDYVLPRITCPKANRDMKKLALLAGIDTPVTVTEYVGGERRTRTVPKHELVSTHIGRRSFVVMCLSRGIAPQIVMKWTGHKHYTSMLPYINISDTSRHTAMRLLDT